ADAGAAARGRRPPKEGLPAECRASVPNGAQHRPHRPPTRPPPRRELTVGAAAPGLKSAGLWVRGPRVSGGATATVLSCFGRELSSQAAGLSSWASLVLRGRERCEHRGVP